MVYLQTALIGLIALTLTPGLLFYFDVTPKVALLLVGAASAVFATGRAPKWFSALLLLNAISLGISAALSPNPALASFGTNWRRFGAVTQIAVWIFAWGVASHAAAGKGRPRIVLRGITLATALAAAYGVAQYFGWDPILPAAGYHIGEGVWTIVRPPGTFGYVSYFATWLAMAAFLAMALAGIETSGAWRTLARFTAALAALAMVLTGTRAAMAGTAVGLVVWLQRSGWRVSRRTATLAAALIAAGALFYFSPAGSPLRSRTRWFVEDPLGGGRILLWRDTLRMSAKHPLFGFGPDVFMGEFPAFESKALAQSYPDFAYESPHNIFLDALVAQGIPGLLILAILVVAGFRAAARLTNPWIAPALAAGLVSQQFTVFTVPTAALFLIAIGLAVALETDGHAPEYRLPWVAAVPVSLALLLLAARLLLADHALALTKRAVDQGMPRLAASEMQNYRRWRLPGSSADLWYSRAMLTLSNRLSDPSQRIEALVQSRSAALVAPQTSEDPFNAWYNLALAKATQQDQAGTEASLRAAIHSHPNWFKPHWTLAQLLRLEGRLEESAREAALAVELDAGKHPEVTKTMEEIQRAQSPQK